MSNAETQLKPGDLVYDKQRQKLSVKCGGKGGYVSIEKLKIPGHKTMSGKDFFNGFVYMKPNNERKFDSTQTIWLTNYVNVAMNKSYVLENSYWDSFIAKKWL